MQELDEVDDELLLVLMQELELVDKLDELDVPKLEHEQEELDEL